MHGTALIVAADLVAGSATWNGVRNMLHRFFPAPEPYDWPVWTYRAALAVREWRPLKRAR